jgi:hypothetical protein
MCLELLLPQARCSGYHYNLLGGRTPARLQEQLAAIHLPLLHPHHADRHHLLGILPPPLNLLSVQVNFPGHLYLDPRTALLVTVFLLLINIFSGVVNDTPNTNDGCESCNSFA